MLHSYTHAVHMSSINAPGETTSDQPQTRLFLLGSPRVEDAGGRDVRFRTRKELALLAYLALESDRSHSRELLANLLWPDSPEDTARNNLRVALSRVGTALQLTPSPIEATRTDVRWHATRSVWIDAVAFEAILHAQTRARTGSDLSSALNLYHGDFLHGFELRDAQPFEEWLTLRRESLHRNMVTALDQSGRECESKSDYKGAEQVARRHIASDPLDERAHRLLMRALALLGDRNGALAQFENCQNILVQELGVEPESATISLATRIREGKLTDPTPQTNPTTRNLPLSPTRFVGRKDELAHVSDLLKRAPLVTLVGPGGIGKTRLALEVAHQLSAFFVDGVHYVALSGIASTAALVPTILRTLGLPVGENSEGQLPAALAGKHILLVLDNLEHLTGCAHVIAALLAASSGLHVLATSRERLRLASEHVASVNGLPYSRPSSSDATFIPEAAALFLQTALRVNPRFTLSSDAQPALAQICVLTRGMPLALELAAGWCASMSLPEIALELEQSAGFLVSDQPDMPERQRSLRAAFDWSWQLLNATERDAFARLSVFREGFTRDAAVNVAEVNLSMLAQLSQKSLLTLQDGRGAQVARYEMHGLLREFASDVLADVPELRHHVKLRHAIYYLKLLASQESQLQGSQMSQAVFAIDTELSNIQKAWRWCSKRDRFDLLLPALFATYQYYLASGRFADGATAFGFSTERLTSPAAAPFRAQVLAMLAHFLATLSRYEEGIAAAREAGSIGSNVNCVEARAHGELRLGQCLHRLDHSDQARAHVTQSNQAAKVSLTCQPENPMMRQVEWESMYWLASIDAYEGLYPAARTSIEHGLRLCQQYGFLRGEALCLANLATIHLDQRDYEPASRYYQQTLALTNIVQSRLTESLAWLYLGEIARLQGSYDEAHRLLERAGSQLVSTGDRFYATYALIFQARLAADLGDETAAHHAIRLLREQTHEIGLRRAETEALFVLVQLALRSGDPHLALLHANQARDTAGLLAEPVLQALCSLWVAQAQAGLGDLEAASVGYITSREAFIAVKQTAAALDSYAGLAELALAEGDAASALSHIEPALKHLKNHPIYGANDPLQVLHTCVRVLRKSTDARLPRYQNLAIRDVERRADHISDSSTRNRFLNLPICHAILTSK